MNKMTRYSPERAVRLVLEHQDEHGSQWTAIVSVAGIGSFHASEQARHDRLGDLLGEH